MPLTQVDQGLLSSAAQYTGFKNRVINGNMVIDQRNNGASVTVNNNGFFSVDRFSLIATNAGSPAGGVFTAQRSTTVPTGFTNSLALTVTTADASPAASDSYRVQQGIEGYNIADLGWGAAGAATVTLSFWVRSSVTGTYAGGLVNAGTDRSYVFTYAVSAANTWEYKTVTIAGDTSGTWNTTNGAGIYLEFDLGSGSTYQGTADVWQAGFKYATSASTKLLATNGATFYITGVQLEKGATATSFDIRDYGRELMMCQRYFKQINGSSNFTAFASGVVRNPATNFRASMTYMTMRVTPTITFGGAIYVAYGTGDNANITLSAVNGGPDGAILDCAIGAGATTGGGGILYTNNNSTGLVNLAAEL
jgi:hypothetical protein